LFCHCLRQPVLPAPVPQVQVDGQSRVPQVQVRAACSWRRSNLPASQAIASGIPKDIETMKNALALTQI